MLPPEMTAALASLSQRDRLLRPRGGKKTTASLTIAEGSSTQPGTVRFAADGEDVDLAAVQGSDHRLPTIVKKTADQDTHAFTPLDDDVELWFNVTGGHYYYFRFILMLESPNVNVGFRLGLTFPSASRYAATLKAQWQSAGQDAEVQGTLMSNGDTLTTTAVPTADDDYIGTIEGILVTNADGVLQLIIGSENGSTDVVVRRGSVAFLYDLGA